MRDLRFPHVESDRPILQYLEPTLAAADADERAAVVALLALETIKFDPDEVAAAVRRALLVVASGGDLRREVTLDDPAVARLGDDLDSPERRAELDAALRRLQAAAAGLPAASETLETLGSDPVRAWQAVAAALLADELTE